MSKLEFQKVDEKKTSVSKPYNVRERKIKDAPYRELINADLAQELYFKIKEKIVVQKKYKEPNYLAKDLARELNTNTRYVSAVINSRFGMNYSSLINEYRVKDAIQMLLDYRFATKSIEEISALAGFANRQSFYSAFYKATGGSPNEYRKQHGRK